jgi:hypothetical protein
VQVAFAPSFPLCCSEGEWLTVFTVRLSPNVQHADGFDQFNVSGSVFECEYRIIDLMACKFLERVPVQVFFGF